MPKYRFPIQSAAGVLVDDTETVELPDDTAARKYGQHIINNLNEDDVGEYFGWTMEIKEGERLVALLPFSKPN